MLSLRAAARLASETYTAYLALGHELLPGPDACAVRNSATPAVYDANHLQRVTAESERDFARSWAFLEDQLGHLAHRHVVTDATTPACVPAFLAMRGLEPKPTIQHLLQDELRGPTAEVEIHEVDGAAGWAALGRLLREDHEEEARKQGRAPWSQEVTDQMLLTKRAKTPGFRWWLARVDDRDAGFFSSWPGDDGVGMVEDLFTHPELRRRGVARALIHRAVADARERGAGPVLIGSDPADWPKDLYAKLGFAPVCVTWSWLAKPADDQGASSGSDPGIASPG